MPSHACLQETLIRKGTVLNDYGADIDNSHGGGTDGVRGPDLGILTQSGLILLKISETMEEDLFY